MADSYIYSMTDTWNDAGKDWAAISMDVQDDGSSASSNLIEMLVGGVAQFVVDKNGITNGRDIAADGVVLDDLANNTAGYLTTISGDTAPALGGNLTTGLFSIVTEANDNVILAPGGTGVVDVRSGMAVSGRITATGLPLTDPLVAGELWNDLGTVKISAG